MVTAQHIYLSLFLLKMFSGTLICLQWLQIFWPSSQWSCSKMLLIHVNNSFRTCLFMNANVSKHSSYSACSLPGLDKSSQVQRKSEQRKVIIFCHSIIKPIIIHARIISEILFEQDNETKTKIKTRAKNTPGYIITLTDCLLKVRETLLCLWPHVEV